MLRKLHSNGCWLDHRATLLIGDYDAWNGRLISGHYEIEISMFLIVFHLFLLNLLLMLHLMNRVSLALVVLDLPQLLLFRLFCLFLFQFSLAFLLLVPHFGLVVLLIWARLSLRSHTL